MEKPGDIDLAMQYPHPPANKTNRTLQNIAPGLHVVSSPIGNLNDTSARAVDTLARVQRIYAEDTRISRRLLNNFGISTPLYSYHDHNGARARPHILGFLKEGGTAALICDAGTPLICDPGLKLVQDAIKSSIPVTAIPGPCAATTALTVSGLPSNMFLVAGFPPAKPGPRRKWLKKLANLEATLIFYEGPSRLASSLKDMLDIFGNRQAALARELTKKFENIQRCSLDTLASDIAENGPPRGEITILVGPRTNKSRPANKERITRYKKGITSENIAALWLMAKGYAIEARRFKVNRVGEIDLVARKGNYTVFVEVKSRSNATDALEAITPTTRRRLKRAGLAWMQRSGSPQMNIRFDAIAMQGLRPIRHVRNFMDDSQET